MFLFLFILPIGFYAFMIEKGWMLDPATDWVVNIYINLFLIGIGVIAFLTGLVLYFHARKSQDPIRKGRAENVLLFGGTAIIIGLGLLMRSL